MEIADIVLSRDQPLERQMRAILAVAGPHAADVHWRPRPGVPHGGVAQAPGHVAEAYRRTLAPEGSELAPEDEGDDGIGPDQQPQSPGAEASVEVKPRRRRPTAPREV